jgi:membrane protein implicated in regulation of membrane protease activity
MLAIVTSCVQSRALLFLIEILGLAAGLAIVLGHTIWSSGLLSVIVTLIGWLTLIRSIILLFLSAQAVGRFIEAVRYKLKNPQRSSEYLSLSGNQGAGMLRVTSE